MMDGSILKPLPPRDRWALLPPPVAQAILGVLYDALDRRSPFDGIELSAFDVAVRRVPPPPGLTSEQFRRAVFEELSNLPWSEGLEPPKGTSWLRHTPVETAADRVFFVRPDLYRFKRKSANHIVAGMRADGLFGTDATVDLNGDLSLLDAKRGDFWVTSDVRANYRAAPMVNSSMYVTYPKLTHVRVLPFQIFLDPDIGPINSDEEAERVIRQMWRYADALYRAITERLDGVT